MKNLFRFTFFALIFFGFIIDQKTDYKDKTINSIFENASELIKVKYNLRPIGTCCLANEGTITMLGLSFNIDRKLSKNELRKLLFEVSKELINQVNKTDGIEEIVSNYPFTQENIEIIIYNYDKDWEPIFDPFISVANLKGFDIKYSTDDPLDKFRYKNIYKETYEEALEALNEKE